MTAVVAPFVSGILGGVSLIGLTIRTLVIILMLAGEPTSAVRFAVIVATAVTTICGIWFPYGEPPNLIMRSNLFPHLGNGFFVFYCGPAAIGTYLVVAGELRRKLAAGRIDLDAMGVLDSHAQDVRFPAHHGEVMTPIELVEHSWTRLSSVAPQSPPRARQGAAFILR